MPLRDVVKNHILETLAKNKGDKVKTAKDLQISLKTVYNKLKSYERRSKQS